DADLAGDAAGGVLVVAGEEVWREAQLAQTAHRRGTRVARGVGDGDRSARGAVPADEHGGALPGGDLVLQRGGDLVEEVGLADRHLGAAHGGTSALPGQVDEVADLLELDAAVAGTLHDRLGDGVLTTGLDTRGSLEGGLVRDASGQDVEIGRASRRQSAPRRVAFW